MVRKILRENQPRRHNPSHLSCYSRERAAAIAECKMLKSHLTFEERRSGYALGRAMNEFLIHSAEPNLTSEEVEFKAGTRTYDGYVAVYNSKAKIAGLPPYRPGG
jgi:hypothetical protein